MTTANADDLPLVTVKAEPEDFVVEEIDAYAAAGEGGHTFVRIRKRDLTTDAAIARLAAALGVHPRTCGAAGMKDRRAVAVQRISIEGVDPAAVLALDGRWPDLAILEAVRHSNKLKPGHLRGNRFTLLLRDVTPDRVAGLVVALERLGAEGYPNAFGAQRFGRDGDNADRALAFVRGEAPAPRDLRVRRLLFSALQARWFNSVLAARVSDGTYATPMLGDLLEKHASGGLFYCDEPEVDRARAEALEVSPTGPMFGCKMKPPRGEPLARELAVLAEDGLTIEALAPHRPLGEGTRRALRILVIDVRAQGVADGVRVDMSLPKGAYATTAIACVARARVPGEEDEASRERG